MSNAGIEGHIEENINSKAVMNNACSVVLSHLTSYTLLIFFQLYKVGMTTKCSMVLPENISLYIYLLSPNFMQSPDFLFFFGGFDKN